MLDLLYRLMLSGPASKWIEKNHVLRDGEFGMDVTNKVLKIGDGQTHWSSLSPFFEESPPLSITDTFVVESQSAMLDLTAQRGDVAIRSDLSKTFILSTDSPTTLADWKELPTPTGQGREEIWDRFADHADGVLTTALTGQSYLNYGTPGALPTIINGKMVLPANPGDPTALGAVYAQMLLDDPVKRIGARWTFGPESTAGGEAVLIAWSTNVQVEAIGDASCHLELSPRGWAYSVFDAGTLISIGSGNFLPNLETDDTTVHSCEVVIDPANSIAYVHLPDGLTKTVTHPIIGSADARYAVWEPIGKNTDTHAAFTDVWADSKYVDSILPAKALLWNKPPGEYVYYDAGTGTIDAPTSGFADIDATNLKITMPPRGPTGRQRITLNGALDMTAPTQVLWAIATGGVITTGVITVANGQTRGRVVADIIGSFTPGAVYTWQHWGVGTGGNINLLGTAGYTATMTAEPI